MEEYLPINISKLYKLFSEKNIFIEYETLLTTIDDNFCDYIFQKGKNINK